MDVILVINAGSSSVKFSVFAVADHALGPICHGNFEEIHTEPHVRIGNAHGETLDEKRWPRDTRLGHDGAIGFMFDWLRSHSAGYTPIGIGHRIVHGGSLYANPVRVDDEVIANLDTLVPLAPLHQPHNLAALKLVAERQADLPQIACFDTAFHHGQPAVATQFALPREITRQGVRRYGFHGLSYEYIASVLPRYDERAARGKTVVMHLGNGASMAALANGKSVASTMGFTAVEGLPMGTRSGTVDPGVLVWLMDHHHMGARDIEALLYRQSGLLGVSGISSDMRTLLDSSDPAAEEAVALFCYRVSRELGSLAAALGGLDSIVFTAGIGEHAAAIRERVCRAAAWLGVSLDPDANAHHGPRISTPGSAVSAWVIPTDEELMIASHTLDLLET
ncbi:acetate/propionate family kinase [Burkholderia sp. Ac-20353]|uniref:acetate/propionate family kinase n=1 Tax=Burkholderia sp. Ac-20353 TaxID=2703894 RepID=UPI00197B34E3|nr:acetate/propionate family kinase [Burkholderia sp. Ac-20353]MBN3786676.1 acetate/propionate family kinase [Burkholderia sp. Ac-20353]